MTRRKMNLWFMLISYIHYCLMRTSWAEIEPINTECLRHQFIEVIFWFGDNFSSGKHLHVSVEGCAMTDIDELACSC